MAKVSEGFGDDIERQVKEWDNLSWAPISEDEGSQIDFANENPFYGTFVGVKTVMVPSKDDPSVNEPSVLLLFKDMEGENRSAWANYRLAEVWESGALTEGVKVKIVHHGKQDIGGGRTLNRMSVYTAPAD